MTTVTSKITGVSVVYLTVGVSVVCSGADQRKHHSSVWLAFVRGIHRSPLNSPHKGPVTRKCFHLMTVSWSSVNLLRWRDNGRDGVSNHQPHNCLLNRLFRRRSKETSKLRLANGNVSIWWRYHGVLSIYYGDVIMGAMASQITSLTIVCSTVYSDADQRKHQSSD